MIDHVPDPYRQSAFYEWVAFKRLCAWIFDVALITVVTAGVGLLTLGLGWIFWPVFYVTISFIYRWFTIARGSATWGMALVSLELRNRMGAPLTPLEAALHTLGFFLATAFVLPQVISALMIFLGAKRQGLHDLALGTVAINRAR